MNKLKKNSFANQKAQNKHLLTNLFIYFENKINFLFIPCS